MNFDFSDEQKALQDQLRRMLSDHCPLTEVRRCLENSLGFARNAWAELAKMGVLGATIPESYGGCGLTYLELCIAAEEMGWALAPLPAQSSLYAGAELLLMAGSAPQKDRWLPHLASGDSIATLAAAYGDAEPTVSAEDGRLTGECCPVADGMYADLFIVLARSGTDESLYLVAADAGGLQREPVTTLDPTKPAARIQFRNCDAQLLGEAGAARQLLASMYNRFAILLAFEQLGGADRALQAACDYAKDRQAFGRAIGSYQAIKHKLANVYISNQLARVHAYFGAWALEQDSDQLPRAAAAARTAASRAFLQASQEMLQIHGGIGFTWESDCQLFYRRAQHSALVIGGVSRWRAVLADQLIGEKAGEG